MRRGGVKKTIKMNRQASSGVVAGAEEEEEQINTLVPCRDQEDEEYNNQLSI